MELLSQIDDPVFVAADTMNCWIEKNKKELTELLVKIDCLIINEDEARLLAGDGNLIKVSKAIIKMGPKAVIVKKGEYGSLLYTGNDELFVPPAYPAEEVVDPTGAGDSFAGGCLGYIAGQDKFDFKTLRKAIIYGTAAASFTISDFSIDAIKSVTKEQIEQRAEIIRQITEF